MKSEAAVPSFLFFRNLTISSTVSFSVRQAVPNSHEADGGRRRRRTRGKKYTTRVLISLAPPSALHFWPCPSRDQLHGRAESSWVKLAAASLPGRKRGRTWTDHAHLIPVQQGLTQFCHFPSCWCVLTECRTKRARQLSLSPSFPLRKLPRRPTHYSVTSSKTISAPQHQTISSPSSSSNGYRGAHPLTDVVIEPE